MSTLAWLTGRHTSVETEARAHRDQVDRPVFQSKDSPSSTQNHNDYGEANQIFTSLKIFIYKSVNWFSITYLASQCSYGV